MSDEVDFPKRQRGKFFKPHATLNLPVYLDDDVRSVLQARPRASRLMSWLMTCSNTRHSNRTHNKCIKVNVVLNHSDHLS